MPGRAGSGAQSGGQNVATTEELEAELKNIVDQLLLDKLRQAAKLVQDAQWALFDHNLPLLGAKLNRLTELLHESDEPDQAEIVSVVSPE